MSCGPLKTQRFFWQIFLYQGRPMTFAEIGARSRVGDERERSGRRTLQGMVNYGVVVVTGSGGKGDPLHYSRTLHCAIQSTSIGAKSAALVARNFTDR